MRSERRPLCGAAMVCPVVEGGQATGSRNGHAARNSLEDYAADDENGTAAGLAPSVQLQLIN